MSFRRADGNWAKQTSARFETARPCLFLDRDGVLIEERNYLKDPELVEIIPGAVEAIAAARRRGWAVTVVTNQSGVARGLISWDQYEAVEQRVADLLASQGAAADMVLACPYVQNGKPPYDRDDPWRKPGPGMLLEAGRALNLDLSRSLLAGDRISDLQAAERAGLRAVAHVMTGYGREERAGIRAQLQPATRLFKVESIAELPRIVDQMID